MNGTKTGFLGKRLERAFADTSDVHVPRGVNSLEYFAQLVADIQAHRCEPHELTAVVMEPGFPDMQIGETVTGLCIANRAGYWLVYEEKRDRFYSFWGSSTKALGAHGIYGSPLYCWSA